MYTFNPIPDVPAGHEGMFLVCMICLFIFVVQIMNEDFPSACVVFVMFLIPTMLVSYGVSYHWTSQEPKTFKNERVTAQLVGFQPEGYREKSGKSMVDRHYMYVVYRVNGNDIILQAQQGLEYPKTAILYKN